MCIFLLLGMAACNPARKFSVTRVEEPVMNGLASVHGRLTVESRAGSDFTVESATIVLRYKGRELATARLMRPITVTGGEETSVRWDFALEGLSLADLRMVQTRLLANQAQFTADVSGRVLWGGIRKKIELNGVPVMEILINFAQ